MFGVDRSRRGAILEDAVRTMQQAWSGEPFEHEGRPARITPTPFRREPLMFVGGSTEIAAKRAARLRVNFWPAIGDPELKAAYEAECAEQGWSGGFTVMPNGPGFVHVTEDPERDWARIGPHALYDAQTYASWQTPGQRSSVHVAAETVDDVKASGVYRVVTPDECVALAGDLGDLGGLVFHPLMGGMDPALGWESLELFESAVRPKL
jgi:alkanesulfonate monooxygenase SsuD/methylene tetrahydromethanopterin reductase-like flavin-dependent oxidoreductase (luciferase family)